MTDRNGGTVSIRLDVKNHEKVRNALRQMGSDGQAALKQLDDASRKPRPSLQALSDVMGELRGRAEAFSARSGLVGTGLQVFGVAGKIAAVGVGVLASSVVMARAAVADLAQTAAEAKRSGLDPETFQEYAYAAQQSRIGIEALTDGIKEMQLRADEFAVTGSGSAAEAFERLGMTQAEVKEKLARPAELFEEIIDKLTRLNRASQIRVSDELFGGAGGEQFVQLLDKGAGHLSRMREEARSAGAVIDKEMLKRAEELDQKFNKASNAIMSFVKKGIVGWALLIEDVSNILTGGNSAAEQHKKALDEVEVSLDKTGKGADTARVKLGKYTEQNLKAAQSAVTLARASLASAIALNQERLDSASDLTKNSLGGSFAQSHDQGIIAGKQSELQAAEKRLVELEDRINKASQNLLSPPGDDGFGKTPSDDKTKNSEAEKAAREQNTLAREAARVRLELGDITGVLAEEEKRLNELVKAGVLTEEERQRALARTKKELLETAEAEKMRSSTMPRLDALTKDMSNLAAQFDNNAAAFVGNFSDTLLDVGDGSLKASEGMKALTRDVLRMAMQMTLAKNVAGPLSESLSALGKGLFGGEAGGVGGSFFGKIGGFISGLLPFANGGVMSPAGSLPLNRYANGGVAYRPQLAMFGEGRSPEAYVPLPDGRSIPVSMRGGGGSNVTVNVHNAPNTRAEVQQRQNADGGIDLDVIVRQVEDTISDRVVRGESSLGRTMERQFGLNRKFSR